MLEFLAQTTVQTVQSAAPATSQPAPPWANAIAQYFPIVLLLIVFYFFMFRSKSGEKKQRADMLSALKKGDRVQTIGGVLGTVLEVRDVDVLLKVDETSNTKMRFIRSAIHRVVTDEKAESKT